MDQNILNALRKEQKRQKNNIELIASENFVSNDILKLQGSIFTNKYAEGYPYNRYYGGCENVDSIEELAIEYATRLFKCKYANVQAHSGSSANMAAYKAILKPNDKILGLNLNHGGHLTHGHPVNFSGMDYNIVYYNLDSDTELLNYEEIEKIALREKPQAIIAGASAYPREIDFKRFKEIAELVNAYLIVDMAHIAGLVATDLHQSPIPYADIVTSTTHKTLRGPRGGLILTNNDEIIKKINKTIFPGIQGGPLMHVIAAKAQCFYEALQPSFKNYQKQVIKNAHVLAETLINNDIKVITNGTDNHLLLIDVKSSFNIDGKTAQEVLDSINITANKNTIPNDTLPPSKTSGLRLGTPAMTTKNYNEEDFIQIGNIISKVLKNIDNNQILEEAKKEVEELVARKEEENGKQNT